MARLRLSSHLSWHARGDAGFSWHQLTGDVCEMSRDVVALCLAFDGGADEAAVCAAPPAGIEQAQVAEFVSILRGRLLLVDEGAPELDLSLFRPYVPRFTVHERDGDDVTIYGRATVLSLPGAARFLGEVGGQSPLAELAPRGRWPSLLRLCRPDLAALKLLPPGEGVPRSAESTMPWPEVDPRAFALPCAEGEGQGRGAFAAGGTPARPEDLAAYHQNIADAEAQFDETETTLSHLFREPHSALGGETFGQRLAAVLVELGGPHLGGGARVVEVGGGLGWVGRALRDRLSPSSYLVVDRSPALAAAQRRRGLDSVVGDALHLPLADGSVDLLVSNEMCGDLGSDETSNHGALALVEEAARVLAPGGLAYISEFGHPSEPPRKSDHLDHDEYSIRFGDLHERAVARGLSAKIYPLPAMLRLDGRPIALVTTRASFAALRAVFRAHGGDLAKRAWLADELGAAAADIGLDLSRVHGVVLAPLGERTMGLCPGEFWALVATRPREGSNGTAG